MPVKRVSLRLFSERGNIRYSIASVERMAESIKNKLNQLALNRTRSSSVNLGKCAKSRHMY